MKLVQATLSVRKGEESSFHHCGGHVKHVEVLGKLDKAF